MWPGLFTEKIMAKLKYLGKKKGYGPLRLEWMIGEVKFADGVSEPVEIEIADAICSEAPTLFEVIIDPVKPKPKAKPKKKVQRI